MGPHAACHAAQPSILRARAYLLKNAKRTTLSLMSADPTAFVTTTNPSFTPKSWLNNALSKPSDEPLDLTNSP